MQSRTVVSLMPWRRANSAGVIINGANVGVVVMRAPFGWVGGLVTPAHGGEVTCDGGIRAVARLERAAHQRGTATETFVRLGVAWVPDVHRDIPAICAPRRARCLTSPASVRLSHD